MDLFATPGNPVPADAIISAVRTTDGLTLRVARWARRGGRGTVVLVIGRSEFIEQYFEAVTDLLDRRFDVVVMDWRGQGQSDREIGKLSHGHVSDFSAYSRDLAALERQILQPFAPRPWFALGHSMGAAILLEQARAGVSPFERLVLTAPMIDLPLRFRGFVAGLSAVAARLGLATMLIPGGDGGSMLTRGFAGNPLTTDRARYERVSSVMRALPQLVVGAPTIGWLRSAFSVMNRFAHPRYAVAITTPVLIVASGADRIVSTPATERFAARLKAGRCITLAQARHQILSERDFIREQFWAAFDAFVPGHELDGTEMTASPATGQVSSRSAAGQRTTTLAPTDTRP